MLLLVPFFFVIVGSRAEWGALADPGMPVLVTGLLVIAMLCKIAGGFIGAWRTGRFRILFLVGVCMTPHTEVALGIAGLGSSQRYISHHVLVALILMTIGAALMGPLLMAHLARPLSISN